MQFKLKKNLFIPRHGGENNFIIRRITRSSLHSRAPISAQINIFFHPYAQGIKFIKLLLLARNNTSRNEIAYRSWHRAARTRITAESEKRAALIRGRRIYENGKRTDRREEGTAGNVSDRLWLERFSALSLSRVWVREPFVSFV